MIMLLCHRPLQRCLLAALLITAMPAVHAAAARSEAANAAIMAAEIALERGDCGGASQNYLKATQQMADDKLAARAVEVALDCGQYATAELAAARWRVLVPNDGAPWLATVRSLLGRARVAEARAPFVRWLDAVPPSDQALVVAGIELLAERSGADVSLAMLREVKHPRLNDEAAQLRLARLALDGWDFQLAIRYATAARQAGADVAAVQSLTARARAGLGDEANALTDAGAAAASGGDQALTLVETLLWLGREAEAEQELLKLREQTRLRPLADRRLALLAFSRGEYRKAEERFTALLRDESSAGLAVYYLAAIAERRGDVETAVRSYELLSNSNFDGAARRRVAGIYYREGEKRQAIQLLAAGEGAGIVDRIGAELQVADLLAREGDVRDGVTRLDSALQSYPGHPEISYQRAVLLERTDSNAAVAALEEMAKLRPADMNVANALGFTLADHNRELPRAEKLIRAALSTQPDNPAVLDSLGWVLYRRNQPAAAVPLLERAFRLYQDGDIGAHLGEVFMKLGRADDARGIFTRALASDPDNKYLAEAARRHFPDLRPPVPPPRLDPGADTAI